MDAETGAITRRRTAPFGEVRRGRPGERARRQGLRGWHEDHRPGDPSRCPRVYPKIGPFHLRRPVLTSSDPTPVQRLPYAPPQPGQVQRPDGSCCPPKAAGGSSPSSSGCGGRRDVSFCSSPTRPTAGVGPAGQLAGRTTGCRRPRRWRWRTPGQQEQAKQKPRTRQGPAQDRHGRIGHHRRAGLRHQGRLRGCARGKHLNIATVSSAARGQAGPKYGLPWNWKKGVDLVSGSEHRRRPHRRAKNWFQNSKLVRQLEGALGKGGCNSFVPGTKVLLADGRRRPSSRSDRRPGGRHRPGQPGARRKTVAATIIGTGTRSW